VLTYIVTITGRYICSANSDCDNNGEVYIPCNSNSEIGTGCTYIYKCNYYTITTVPLQFISGLRQIGFFSSGNSVSSTNKTGHHDISEILLKVVH
jgi:hypothetical protein